MRFPLGGVGRLGDAYAATRSGIAMTTLAAHPTRSIYGAFAATRLALSRSQLEISGHYDPTMRFWFARFELYIALLILMDNWYAASAGGGSGATRLSNLISQMPCSYTKARQAIAEAIAQGFVRLVASEADHRLKVVKPTERTIGVWEAYFDEALAIMEDTGLIELLIERREALKSDARPSCSPATSCSSAIPAPTASCGRSWSGCRCPIAFWSATTTTAMP
jgi:hypothetical protein